MGCNAKKTNKKTKVHVTSLTLEEEVYASEDNINSVWNVGYNPKYYHRMNKCKVGCKSLCCSATEWPSHNTNNLISPISRYSQVTVEISKSSLSVQHIHSGPVSSRQGFCTPVALENATICSVSFRSPPITGCNVLTMDRALLADLHNNNTDSEYITIYTEIFKRQQQRII